MPHEYLDRTGIPCRHRVLICDRNNKVQSLSAAGFTNKNSSQIRLRLDLGKPKFGTPWPFGLKIAIDHVTTAAPAFSYPPKSFPPYSLFVPSSTVFPLSPLTMISSLFPFLLAPLSLPITTPLSLPHHTHTQPFYGPFSGTTRVSRCQKRTSGLYGARED